MSDDNKEGAGVPVAEHFVGYLCRAWGESDRPSAELARDLEGVSRFMVREWLGEEDAVDYDGTPTIPRLMAEWEEHDWKDEPLWSAEFEIGGVSVERVDCTVATPPAVTPLADHKSANVSDNESCGSSVSDNGHAVMPAAPSDAATVTFERLPYEALTAIPLMADWSDSREKMAFARRVAEAAMLSCEWQLKQMLALSQTMQPQAGAEPVDWESASERYLADIIDRAPEPLRRLGDWLSQKLDEDEWKTAERYVLGAMESLAAAGEQAGAVAQCPNCKGTRAPSPLDPDWRGRCECAAPGAAIAAREQEDAVQLLGKYRKLCVEIGRGDSYHLGRIDRAISALASRQEAPATPQGETAGLSEVTERYCNKCGYFGPDQIHYRPNGLGECGYIARIRTQPTTVQQEPDPLLIDSMCMRWRHDFGLQRDADDQLSSGITDAERDSLRSSMRQLWEEVVGRGFYRPAALKGMQSGERKEGAE